MHICKRVKKREGMLETLRDCGPTGSRLLEEGPQRQSYIAECLSGVGVILLLFVIWLFSAKIGRSGKLTNLP